MTVVTRNRGFAERFNAAMAEAGYRATLEVDEVGRIWQRHSAPCATTWQALFLAKAGDPHPCWACWHAAAHSDPFGSGEEVRRWASDCVTGRRGGCHFPDGPARPSRRELTDPVWCSLTGMGAFPR